MSAHNPAGLTDAQYGRDQGYRLLEVDEVHISFDTLTDNIEVKSSDGSGWVSGVVGGEKCLTYRTKLSREALATARGLTPKASEPEKADVFDAWMRSEQGRQDLSKIDTSNYRSVMIAAFLAGQRSERDEMADQFAGWSVTKKEHLPTCFRFLDPSALREIARYIRAPEVASREPKGDQPSEP